MPVGVSAMRAPARMPVLDEEESAY
jgi:hypothetical protein